MSKTPITDAACMVSGMQLEIVPASVARKLEEQRNELLADKAELQATFDLMFSANQRGISMWQAAHPGNDLVWPDQAKLVAWLCEQVAAVRQEADRNPQLSLGHFVEHCWARAAIAAAKEGAK